MSAGHEAHGDDHGHGHGSRFIQHHYDDAQHQFDSGKFAIWLFLAQEVLFFSALFVAYVLYRHHHPELYSYAHKWLDVKYGAINTAVLIFSSLTAAWAVRCAQLNQRKGLIACLVLTLACACTFLGIKYIEYSHKYHENILFGRYFDPCVSPGGVELLTKANNCAGVKSTIVWDATTASSKAEGDYTPVGCFEAAKIDLDPVEPGVQADCAVKELESAWRERNVVDKDGKPKLDADGSPVTELYEVDTPKRDITQRCAEEGPEGEHAEPEHAEHAEHAKPVHEEAHKFPCWRPAYQPAVCPDLTSGPARAHGVAAQPQVGILVEYGDHEHRDNHNPRVKDHEWISIKAECKAPPPPPKPGSEPHGPAESTLGKKLVHKAHVVTAHEEHEIESRGPPPEHTNMFFTIYFAMTGLHGIHVFVGVIVFIWLLIRAIKGHFTPDYFGPIDYAALYWHIVDLIWIFLFPLLYLIH